MRPIPINIKSPTGIGWHQHAVLLGELPENFPERFKDMSYQGSYRELEVMVRRCVALDKYLQEIYPDFDVDKLIAALYVARRGYAG